MVTEITHGVKISVDTNFLPDHSSPGQHHYVFSYRIRIENKSDYTVKLLTRSWLIYDSTGQVLSVEGEGVVGQQPTLKPGETHEYISGCNLKTGLGKMNGIYSFTRLIDDTLFDVTIPEFNLVVPYKLN